MCLFPKLIKNPKYIPNKKNNYNPPICKDERIMFVPIGCGMCEECMKKKSREWQIRLNEELKVTKKCTFVTLTFNEEELNKICKEVNTKESNAIATIAVRRFLERYRKKHKKSIKHWLVTEIGHNGTERIHLHGLIWDIEKDTIKKYWKYGNIWCGDYVNKKTINYIVKYIHKIDQDHKQYKPIILTSKGIGRTYIENAYSTKHKYKKNNTQENYRLPTGQKTQLPIYYRNYLWNEEEREKLWLEKLDKQERWILGQKIDISTEKGEKLYFEILKNAQEKNKKLGYGDNSAEWKKKDYNVTNKELNKLTKIKKYKEEKNKIFNKL